MLEGAIWIHLHSHETGIHLDLLRAIYLLTALTLWPVLAPFSVWLVEPPSSYRRAILGLCLLGAVLSLFYITILLNTSSGLASDSGHLAYRILSPADTGLGWNTPSLAQAFRWSLLAYAGVTVGPFLLSQDRVLRWFGLVIGIGLGISLVMHRSELISVWCFFAALASILLVGVFARHSRICHAGST